MHSRGAKGEVIIDDSFYVIFNAAHHPMDYQLPTEKYGTYWIKVLDTSEDFIDESSTETYPPGGTISVASRAVVVLKNPVFELATADTLETEKSVLKKEVRFQDSPAPKKSARKKK